MASTAKKSDLYVLLLPVDSSATFSGPVPVTQLCRKKCNIFAFYRYHYYILLLLLLYECWEKFTCLIFEYAAVKKCKSPVRLKLLTTCQSESTEVGNILLIQWHCFRICCLAITIIAFLKQRDCFKNKTTCTCINWQPDY